MILKQWMMTIMTVCSVLAVSVPVFSAPAAPAISAEAAYVINGDTEGELYAKNPDQRMYPGSTTKIMTCILGLELGHNRLDQPITITTDSLNLPDASILGIYPGDKVSLREAMTGMMLVSGCDVAVDVAETVTPSQQAFVQEMNNKAAQLGATHTHFTNPHGLPDANHYTTARDLAKMAAYGMKMTDFRSMVSHSEYDMPYMNGGTKKCISTNHFLTNGFAGANGIKTGTTNAGGACLVASATQDGRTVIAVILKSEDRFGDAQKLMTYGFSVLPPKENVYITREELLQRDAEQAASTAAKDVNTPTAGITTPKKAA